MSRVPDDVAELADPLAFELVRVTKMVREAERARMSDSPEKAIAAMRARGRASMTRRLAVGRERLRRAIGYVDRLFPGRPNCYRRTLLELALDAGAADETIVFGLDVGRTGHVAFKGREDQDGESRFDVVFEITA